MGKKVVRSFLIPSEKRVGATSVVVEIWSDNKVEYYIDNILVKRENTSYKPFILLSHLRSD